jgi:hypothetical protein
MPPADTFNTGPNVGENFSIFDSSSDSQWKTRQKNTSRVDLFLEWGREGIHLEDVGSKDLRNVSSTPNIYTVPSPRNRIHISHRH